MKVSELGGADLDYWVAHAVGKRNPRIVADEPMLERQCVVDLKTVFSTQPFAGISFAPSSEWRDGGPLIDEYIHMVQHTAGAAIGAKEGAWMAFCFGGQEVSLGSTCLEAVCRAIVELEFGEEVPDVSGS